MYRKECYLIMIVFSLGLGFFRNDLIEKKSKKTLKDLLSKLDSVLQTKFSSLIKVNQAFIAKIPGQR